MPNSKNYLIIGFGEFGAVTAHSLLDSVKCSVTIIDDQSPQSASCDIFKIIRDDYGNTKRMELAIAAHEKWRRESFYSTYYRQTGRLAIYFPDALHRLNDIDDTRRLLTLPPRQRVTRATIEQHKHKEWARFASDILEVSDQDLTLVFNEDDGIVKWDSYMHTLRSHCLERGAKIIPSTVSKLIIENRNVSSILLNDGVQIDARDATIVLAAGAWTSSIIHDSSLPLPANPRVPVATGVFAFHLALSDDELRAVSHIPPFSIYGIDMELADGGEYLPPVDGSSLAKIGWTLPYKNTQLDSQVSRPEDVSKSFLARKALQQVKIFLRRFLPQLLNADIVAIRSPWDGVTTTQTPLLAKHPALDDLFIVAGGSYNHAKDAPLLGSRIVSILHGSDDSQYGWDILSETSQSQAHLQTAHEFRILEAKSRDNPDAG